MSALTDALAGMELTDELPEGALVSDAIVIARLVDADTGSESFLISVNDAITHIVQLGLLHAALNVVTGKWSVGGAGDDE